MIIDEYDRAPILFLEVNLAPGNVKKLVVFEGEDSVKVVDEFSKKYSLAEDKKAKLLKVV